MVTKGRIQPPDADAAEYWSYKGHGHGGSAPWFIRVVQMHGRFWDHPIDDVYEVNSEDESPHPVVPVSSRREKELVDVSGIARPEGARIMEARGV